MTPLERRVYQSVCEVGQGTAQPFINICGEVGANEPDILVALLTLEFAGKILFLPGKYYCKNTKYNRKALGRT